VRVDAAQGRCRQGVWRLDCAEIGRHTGLATRGGIGHANGATHGLLIMRTV